LPTGADCDRRLHPQGLGRGRLPPYDRRINTDYIPAGNALCFSWKGDSMDEQRPPDATDDGDTTPDETPPTPEDAAEELPPSSEQPTTPIEQPVPPPADIPAETPDAQATQPIAYPPRPATPPVSSAGEPVDTAAQLELLRRLTPSELTILRLRCSGTTTQEISGALGITPAAASAHLGNIYDKLGITYGADSTASGRLLPFCSALNQPGAPVVPPVVSFNRDPNAPAEQPSQRAVQLVAADEAALLAQQPATTPPPSGNKSRSGWVAGGILAGVILLALIVFAIASRNNGDDDDDNQGAATATTGQATGAASTATTAGEPTAEATATTAEEPTATEEPPTATTEPTATEEPPTATTEPTATEEPPTATTEPTATKEPPTATTEPTPVVTPQPAPGDVAYQSDWANGPGDWQLTDGWTDQGGQLVADGATAAPLLAPFTPAGPNYAVEVQLTLANVSGCDTLAGPFARVTQQSNIGGTFPAGYMGNVCAQGWRIDATNKNSDNRDTLASGAFTLDNQPHTYRLEVNGTQIRLFIDGTFAGEATDDRWSDGGQVGIYLNGNIQVTVASFKVYTLSGGG
jgi:DNA-binding CsgD family transcriptional regulator